MNTVETERLNIREITSKDLINLRLVLSDAEVMKYSIVGVHTDEDIKKYIINCQQQYCTYGYGQWAMFLKENDKFVGICGLNNHVVENHDLLHVSYRLVSSQQGKGFASEATVGITKFCKRELKLNTVAVLIDPENKPSLKVAQNAGFLFVKSSEIQGFKVDLYEVNLQG